jgi:hypothetical protein
MIFYFPKYRFLFCEKHCQLYFRIIFQLVKLRGKSASAVDAAVAESINFVLDLLWRINIKGRATGTICVLSHRVEAEGSQHRESSLSDGKHHAIFL